MEIHQWTMQIRHSKMGNGQWTMDDGTMEQWNNGTMEQWNNGTMEQWDNGIMEKWINGLMD
jgi:hypothetical protein